MKCLCKCNIPIRFSAAKTYVSQQVNEKDFFFQNRECYERNLKRKKLPKVLGFS